MPAVIEIDERANEETLLLAPGQSIAIRLPENPTTGYQWIVESVGKLQLDSDSFLPSDRGVGSGGSRRLQFSAGSAGRSHIRLALKRSWDATGMAQEHFSVDVISQESLGDLG
jgi:inhibitor of cysteine peptidase